MKKTVKSLIVAASVAAIAGIGAVSFAAWSGGNPEDITHSGASGSIVTAAGTLGATSNLSDTVKLVPYDQVAQYSATTMAKMQTINLTYTQGSGAASSNYNFTMALTKNDDSLALYYKLGTATVPTNGGEDYNVTDDGWIAFTLDEDVDLTLTSDAATINVILVSTATGDMNKSYEITFSANEITE